MAIIPVVSELLQHVPSLGTGDGFKPDGAGSVPDGGSSLPFADVLKDAVASANSRAEDAHRVAGAFAAGASDDIHGTMIATKEADIELKLVANVRSKLVDAFNDLWHMNI
jgi:flagellar hook-basal body complex protein FliE